MKLKTGLDRKIDFLKELMDLLVKPTLTPSDSKFLKNESDPSWIPISQETSWSKLLLPPREYHHDQFDESIWTDSLKVVKFLCSDIEENKNWINEHRKQVLLETLRIFDENSQGSLRYARFRCPDRA
jgi:hypothetical protein